MVTELSQSLSFDGGGFFFFFGNHEKSSRTDEQNVLKLNKYILCSRFQLSESSCTKQLQTQS